LRATRAGGESDAVVSLDEADALDEVEGVGDIGWVDVVDVLTGAEVLRTGDAGEDDVNGIVRLCCCPRSNVVLSTYTSRPDAKRTRGRMEPPPAMRSIFRLSAEVDCCRQDVMPSRNVQAGWGALSTKLGADPR
jgi:hypothetical protein